MKDFFFSLKIMIKIIFIFFEINICTLYGPSLSRSYNNTILEKCDDYAKICDPKKTLLCCDNRGICRTIRESNNNLIFNVSRCLQPAMFREFCHHDIECLWLDNAICDPEHSQCECLPNYGTLRKNGKCVALIGGPCLIHASCQVPNSICVDKKCQCSNKYIEISPRQCVRTSIGRKCQKDVDCNDILHIGCSVNKKCVCKDDHILENNSTCVPLLGEFCWSDDRCAVENSVCFNNVCQCKTGYFAVSNSLCLEMKLGRSCKSHDDCDDTPNAECSVYGKCVCKENFLSLGTEFCRGKPDSMDERY